MTFKENALVELCDIVSSKRVFAASYQSEGVPFFRGKEVSQLARGENTTAELYISDEVYNDVISRTGPINSGDILLTAVGTLGNPYQVKETDLPFYFKDGNIVWLRKFSKEINSTYLFYWLNSEYGRSKVLDTAIGSTQAALTIKGLGAISISFPSLAQQNGIVRILSAIDQKIKMNNALSKTLEGIAQTIFKSWFIDFDPVKAREKGQKPDGMSQKLANLFPNSFAESELGMIPAGWECISLGTLCETLLGGTPTRAKEEFWNGEIPWINSGKVNEFRINTPTECITHTGLKHSATKLLPKGTTVLAITGATLGQFSRLEIEACANQSVVGIIQSEKASNEFIYLNIKNNIMRLISAQTGGAQQHINKEDVNAFKIIYPGQELMSEFTSVVLEQFNQIGNLMTQNIVLSEMRDSLLPRLISGELQLPNEMLAS